MHKLSPQAHAMCAFSSEVAAARAAGKPIVALESTIITHGMPFPANVETARAVEAEVRARGATPATIAVFDGRIRVGLDQAEMDWLAKATGVLKLSRADLAYALSSRRPGSTTVAATMIAADLAGIAVFATGGIGGVHREAESTFDVSADLQELARTPVTVVCAGAKAILDLPKTFEMLETLGVPVIGHGTDNLPAFWSRDGGIPSPIRLDSAAEIAAMLATRRALGLEGGVLVCNPVPLEDEIPAGEVAVFVDRALADARAGGVTAKAVTPYLLSRMLDLTDGRSLRTNIALIRNNARLAAEIAVALG